MRFGAVQGRDQQNTMVKSLCRLMKLESCFRQVSTFYKEFGCCLKSTSTRVPMLEVPFCFSACLVWLKRFWRRKGVTLQFAKDDSVAGDIDEKGASLRELRVHLLIGVNDEVYGRSHMMGDRQFLHKAFARFLPGFILIGKMTVIYDHQEIVIRQIATFAVLDPVAARVGTE